MTTSQKRKYTRYATCPQGEPYKEKWRLDPDKQQLFANVGRFGIAVFNVLPGNILQQVSSHLPGWWQPLSFEEFLQNSWVPTPEVQKPSSYIKAVRAGTTPHGSGYREIWSFNPEKRLIFVNTDYLGKAIYQVRSDNSFRTQMFTFPKWWKPMTFEEFMQKHLSTQQHRAGA